MGRSQALPFLLLLCLEITLCSAGVPGTEFITAFLQNHNRSTGNPTLSLSITALQDSTTVSVRINTISASSFNPKFTLNKLEEKTILLPSKIQLVDSGSSSYVVSVFANNPVSVVSLNFKELSSDSASLFPVTELGTEYYIVTPPEGSFKEFAIIAKDPATLTILPSGTLTYSGKTYGKGSSFKFSLDSYQVIQFQSGDDLSGTKVLSNKPVAVLSGHTCSMKFTKCNHVYEQLQPTFIWGTMFFIPTVSFQTKYDLVYVTAATQNTLVTYQAGSQQKSEKLDAGDVMELQLKANTPLVINATDGIQVMQYSTGGYKGTVQYDTVLMTVPDVTSFCTSFQTWDLEDFSNEAIIVAKTSDLESITVNKASLGDIKWNTIQGAEYSWGEFPLTSSSSQYVFESSKSPFSLSVFGISNLNAFGEGSTCLGGSSRPSCSQVTCRKKEVCKINHGKATCQGTGEATCWAWGDPHYHTFDGKNYDFQGTCSYTMSKTCDPDLPFFNIETMNENRGSSLVSYLKSVNIQVYDYNITGVRSEFGIVRVNNQRVQLPLYLNNNKLILLQSGTSLILKTDFKLKVIYDWNILLKITVPSTYYGSVCGLCGNYNDNPKDDLSDDGNTLSPIAYSQLWKVKETSEANCHDDCDGECVPCTSDKKKLYGSNQYCGILTQSNGPFKACREKVDSIYKDNCVYDMCLNDGHNQIFCQTLKAYSDACAREGIQVEDWRNITNCPMDCPGNSTYNPCGSACPATCLDPKAPSTCTEPCMEVCECDAGFVMIEGQCQPKRNCGCLYNGRSINPGDSFWDDPNCNKKCFCNPITRKVECNNTKCANGEKCLVIDGIQDCFPTKYKTCSASGDPHYVTFDDFHYDFQGSCQYLLSGLCKKRNDLDDFEVIVLNQNQGSLLVSYTTAVTFRIFGIEIQIRREFPATVLVDGIKSNIPLKSKTKLGNINIFQSGRQCIVQTNIGIRVTFDWEARVGVELPSTYSGSVCGLCGNFNNNPTDDLGDRNGNLQSNVSLFGHSWREGENAEQCKIPKESNCTGLLRLEREQKKNRKQCGMVIDTKGPFRDCHSKINPESYFEDCVYDMCAYGERQDLICRLLTGYAAACQDAGAVIYEWRSDFVCPMSCPLNSRYNVCVSECPSTCLSLSLSTTCDTTCREGCECQAGYVLSGTECVPLSQCGCLYNSQYYKPGDIFYPENTCESKCTCNNGGTVMCEPTSCGPYEECSIVKGVQSCNPVGNAICSAIGRTTFNTFDNFGYDFNGNCSYILSETCLTEGSALTPYVIQIRNIDGSVTTSKKVVLEVYNYTVTLLQGNENKILVNDILRNIPFELEGSSLRADYQGGGLVLKTNFGLIITLDNAVHVTIPATYHNQTCGLCGNYNDDIKDDLRPYDDDAASFADSWKEPEEFCVTNEICSGVNQTCPDCPRSSRKQFSGENFCGILTSPSGPFSPCHDTIDPKVYLTSCVNTLCAKTGDHCTILQGYAKLCQDTGIAIKSWRTPIFCPYTCSQENSHYELCADVCSTSCSSLYDLTSCPTTCSEGCECDTGFFFQNGLCVTPDLCDRCILNSTFYKINQTIISEDCSQSCTCTSRHVMVCEAYGCASDEICTVLDGQVQCINKDPCKSVTCRNKEHCEANDGNIPVCVPDYTSSCTVWGDPHFTTFDGYNFDFHGTCTYTLAEYVGSDATLEYFSVEEKNDNRGNPSSSSVRLINIFVYNSNISMLKDEPGKVRLNGESLNLPLINDKFTVAQSGPSVVLKTSFGLRVEYDYDYHVEITIPSTYYATTGGLCGNFNGNSRDDKVSRNNKQLTVITKWAMSWKVSDGDDFCWDICHGNCAECNETLKTLYEGEEYCGLLEADDGPFKDCYDTVSSAVFFDNCVKDVCSHDGLGLCQAFEAYVAACRKEGVLIQDWRNSTGCNMNCPENSHYEFCGTACEATCLDKTSPNRCTEPCRETCQCNEGYVFSDGQCIDVTTCGCIYKDLYYKPNQEFWLDDHCSVHCKCDPILGMVVCTETKCQETERCMVRGGVRGCYPVSYSTCISTGDPHYTTFDGRKYDFMGTCTYQLTGLCPSVNPSLTPFQVKVQNDRRTSKTVSYTKSLTLEVYNQTITLTRDYPHRVLVNGVAKFLPLSLESNRIKAFMKGEHAFVRTDFEVTINYNWENYGRVMVPNTYAEALCGLCGNFNQDPSDDLTPKGTAEDKNKFEEKYRVGEGTECKAGCVGECPDCSTNDTLKYSDKEYCGIIKKPDGPFSQCFDVIDPTPFFTNCLYDSCLSGGQYSAICGAIAQYVSECQEKGVSIDDWRKYTICEPICPPNSHYEICGPGCHATCSNLNSDCQKSCTEGCYCDSGFVLSGDTCVSFSECGCDYNDTYYQRGHTFYLNDQCNEQCLCTENGVVECQAVSCNSNEECNIVNGAIGCHSKTTSTCLMAGNRHFVTFDGLSYNLQGSCSYTLTEVCEDLELGNFSIVARSGRIGKDNIVGTQSLQVNVHGYEIMIDRDAQWTVKINEEIRILPLILENGKVEIHQEGSSIVLQTDFEVVVRYDTINSVHITVPSAYKGALCGLCGDFNGHFDDDLRLPSGQLAASAEEYGASWSVNGQCYCEDKCKGCDHLRMAIFSRDEACGLLLKKDGPFADCYGLVNVTSYFDQCLFDMCASDGQAKILCQSLQAYVTVCQAAGAKIQAWRSTSFCRLECPLNSHYELCTHTCDVSCSAVSGPTSCTDQCSEGCQCDDGYLFDANSCVSMENCGCFYNGRYYNLGDSVVSTDCLQQCKCHNGGMVECTQFNCSDAEYCGLQEGKQGCFEKHGTCTLSGSGNLVSFDNLSGSVIPDNTFDFATVCRNAESWFRIVVITQSCAASDKFDISAVHVYFSEFSVALRPDGQAWLNGRGVSLPLTSGAVTIESTQGGFRIRSGEDLEFTMGEHGDLTLNVHQKFSGSLCGACGNFNRKKSDDLQTLGGKSLPNFSEFIASLTARDFTGCDSSEPPNKNSHEGNFSGDAPDDLSRFLL